MLANLKRFSVRYCDLSTIFWELLAHDYAPVVNQFGLASLTERRRHINLNFFKELLAGEVDSPTLPSLNFKVPQRSSYSTLTFCIPLSATNYMKNEPIRRLIFNANTDPTINL